MMRTHAATATTAAPERPIRPAPPAAAPPAPEAVFVGWHCAGRNRPWRPVCDGGTIGTVDVRLRLRAFQADLEDVLAGVRRFALLRHAGVV
jgi:hypothetical protein